MKENNTNDVIELLVIIEFFSASFIVCLNMLGYANISSILIALNFILVLAIFVVVLSINQGIKSSTILFWVLFLFISFTSVYISTQSLSFQYMKKWIMFVCTLLLWYCISEIEATRKMIVSFFISAMILAACFIFMYYTGKSNFMYGGVTFNLSNPNFAGICLLCTIIPLFSMIAFVKNNFYKLLLFVVGILLISFLEQTNARSCLVALAGYFIIRFFFKTKYSKLISIAVILFPLIFAVFYLTFVSEPWFRETFDFMISEGKSLTSRVNIWKNTFGFLQGHWFFGNYYSATGGTGLGQLHNICLDTLAAYGVPVFVFMVYLICSVLNNIGEKIEHKYQSVAIFGFYAIYLSATFEASLISCSQGMYIMPAGLLMLANYKVQNTPQNSKKRLFEI